MVYVRPISISKCSTINSYTKQLLPNRGLLFWLPVSTKREVKKKQEQTTRKEHLDYLVQFYM